MKKVFLLLIFMIAHAALFAQSDERPVQTDCLVYIEPSFDSKCVLTDYAEIPELIQSGSKCNLVCKNSVVTYTAKGTNGSYIWTISGADTYTVNGNTATVHWGNGASGIVKVQLTTGSNICIADLCVVMIEPAQVGAKSNPEYRNVGGNKVIEICLGETIYFTDNSTATSTSPITGYLWRSNDYGVKNTKNYVIKPTQAGSFTLEHTVINSCGCESVELYEIIVNPTDLRFELSCYGTVCAGTRHRYSLETNIECGENLWVVENGTIISQDKYNVEIEWHNSPLLGYGVISYDLSGCSHICNNPYSVKIPIISDNAEIKGSEAFCTGVPIIYEVPLWAATEYIWTVTPQDPKNYSNTYKTANTQLMIFDAPGTYEISVAYNNEFLDCGWFNSLTKTVVVGGNLAILSDAEGSCLENYTSTATFTTTIPNYPSTWYIYDDSGNLIHTETDYTLTYTFYAIGEYKIVAFNDYSCESDAAVYYYQIVPKPQILYLNTISGPHTTCKNGAITLSATPTSPLYDIVWKPVCQSGTISGNTVSINYGNVICDVEVRQYDRMTGCYSDPVIYHVEELTLAPLNNTPITVYAGGTTTLSVPNQDGVLYHWTFDSVRLASVVGSAHNSSVNVLINGINGAQYPYTITATLERKYCEQKVYETVALNVVDTRGLLLSSQEDSEQEESEQSGSDDTRCTPPQISVSFPDEYCEKTPIKFEIAVSGDVTKVKWDFGDGSYIFGTNNIYHTYTAGGQGVLFYQVTVTAYNANCSTTYSKQIIIRASNLTTGQINLAYPQVCMGQARNISWSHYQNGNSYIWSPPPTTNSYQHTVYKSGNYSVTVTSDIECVCQEQKIVPFYHLPTARIYGETSCCLGEIIELYGNTGETDVKYKWIITRPDGLSFSSSSPNIAIVADQIGDYNISLDISNINAPQCTSNAFTTVKVKYMPTIVLEFAQGSSQCIANPPVCVTSTSHENLYWSNGDYGPSTCFYNDGFITAYYSEDGCRSKTAEFFICPQPNYDALLTGCYEKCNVNDDLPVYNIIPFANNCNQSYDWYQNGGIIQSNYFSRNGIDYLPVSEGEHYMIAEYGGGCAETSQTLTLKEIRDCCYSVDINWSNCFVQKEKLYFDMEVEICNTGKDFLYLDYLEVNDKYTITGWSTTSSFLKPGECAIVNIRVEANDFILSSALFTLFGKGSKCNINFSVPLDPKKCMCDTEVNVFGADCHIEGGRLLYDIEVEICNTGSNQLNLDHLFVNDAYSIQNYNPQPLIIAPGKCEKLHILIEVKDFSQTSAFFALFDDKNNCFTPFTVKLDPTKCMCDNKVTIINTGCYKQEGRLFYDIRVEICNTGTDRLDLYNLMVNSGYTIHNWSPQPLSLRPGECSKLEITLEVNDLSQTSAFFTMFDERDQCFTSFSIPLDPKRCMCGSEVKTLETYCHYEGCRLFYDIAVEICNTGTTDLNLEDLIVNNGYTILGWDPQSMFLHPGECHHLFIKIEVNDFNLSSAFFTMYDKEHDCYVDFLVKLDWKECIKEVCQESNNISLKFIYELSNPQTVYFDFWLWLPTGTTNLLSLWVEPPRILNYNYYPALNVDGRFMFDRHYLEQMAEKDEKVCVYALVCINGHLCLVQFCIPARELLEYIKGTSPMPAPPNMQSPKGDDTNTVSHNISIYPNPAKNELFVVSNGQTINNVEITDLAGKTIVNPHFDYAQQPQRKIDVSLLPQGMYLVKIYTENGITVKKFIKR